MINKLCVFCGSSPGKRPEHARAAHQLGTLLARQNVTLVYGGAGRGLMRILADAVLADGGTVTGVIPKFLVDREVAHTGLSELVVVGSMHERKQKMASLADGFITLPGGLGTLEEMAETLTWAQLGLHEKPCGLLDVGGFFEPLLRFLDQLVTDGFMGAEQRRLLIADDDAQRLLDRLRAASQGIVH